MRIKQKELKKWQRILALKNDIRDGMIWDEAEVKYDISRPTISVWLKKEIPEEILTKIKNYEKRKQSDLEFIADIELKRMAEEKSKEPTLCKGLNQLEFIENEEGLGFKLFPMQRLIVKAFYNLELTEEEKAELTKLKSEGKTTWEQGQKYTELVLMIGMKGGKTELISAISCAEERELYKLGNPQKYYNLPEGKEIYIINVATEKDQAKDTIFASTEARIKHSNFYKQRDYKPSAYDYEFPSTNVKLLSGHSNSSSIVGRTAKLVMFDELARFTEKKTGKSSGKRVYNSLTRSVAPFKNDSRIVSLSSTLHEHDMINVLYEQSGKIKTMLGFKLATWEINPNLPFDCDFLQTELEKSPEDFWRDYGVQPSKAVEKYIRDRLKIDKSFLLGRKLGLGNPFSSEGTLIDSFKGNPEFNYYMHLDPAVNNCSFGMAIAYKHAGIVRVLLAYGIKAKGNKEIDFEELKELIGLILDRFPTMKKVTFDSYIAASLSQYIQKRGVLVEFLSVQKEEYDALKIEGLYAEKLAMYYNKVLDRELKQLDLENGKKVEHPSDGSKDVSDAVAGAVSHALKEDEVGGEIVMTGTDPDSEDKEAVSEDGYQGLIFRR